MGQVPSMNSIEQAQLGLERGGRLLGSGGKLPSLTAGGFLAVDQGRRWMTREFLSATRTGAARMAAKIVIIDLSIG